MKAASIALLLAAGTIARADSPQATRAMVQGAGRGTVTLHYDFEDPAQLEDFEIVRPHRLFPKGDHGARIEKGRLLLAGGVALRHRVTGVRIRARVRVWPGKNADAGTLFLPPDGDAPEHYVFLDLDDRHFHGKRAMLLGAVGVRDERLDPKGDVVVWRDIAEAERAAVEPHLGGADGTELAVVKEGAIETCRVGGLWRMGDSATRAIAMPAFRFGLWTRAASGEETAFDDLTLTIAPPEGVTVAALPDPGDESPAALLKAIKSAPLSDDARRAATKLSRRGEDEWKKLARVVRDLERKQPYAALPIVRVLAAWGAEPERTALLAELYRKAKAPDVKMAAALGLADGYPEHAEVLHEALGSSQPGRERLLRAMVLRGLPGDVLSTLYEDPLLAAESYEVTRARGAAAEGDLGELPKLIAKRGHSRAASIAFAQDFAREPNWPLVTALTKLLHDKDPEIAEGAYLVLLTISDRDLAPDADLWRSWISAKKDAYETPRMSDAGPVAATILRGRRYLRADLERDGAMEWPTSPDWPATRVGATALGVYALRVAGVPAKDPVIQKALRETLLPGGGLRGDLEGYTYALCMLALALEQVDREAYPLVMQALATQIVRGQLANGQWTYYCHGEEYKRRPRSGDNSNSQFAILGLRSLRRCGVDIADEPFRRAAAYWLSARNAYGGWGYGDKTFKNELSMTAAGISTLAICAEALHGAQALRNVRDNKQVGAGQLRLGELLLNDGYADQEIYALYGVERACILTGTSAFNEFDWYHEGAEILVRGQKESGAWGDPTVRGVDTGRGYGEAVDTAFALLFLKRSTTGLAGADGSGVVEIPARRRPSKPH